MAPHRPARRACRAHAPRRNADDSIGDDHALAQDKAFTAAVSRRGTHEYNASAVPGQLTFGIQSACGGRFSTVGGGLPVVVANAVVGGIGCSSGTPEQDMACAQAGIDHFQKKLKDSKSADGKPRRRRN